MITIKIKTDNAAFQDGNRYHEVARILRAMADQVDRNATVHVRDINGNTCGSVIATGKDRHL